MRKSLNCPCGHPKTEHAMKYAGCSMCDCLAANGRAYIQPPDGGVEVTIDRQGLTAQVLGEE